MKIKAIDGREYDSEKTSDLRAEVIEKLEGVQLKEFANKYGLEMIAITAHKTDLNGYWCVFVLPSILSYYRILCSIASLIQSVFGGKYRLQFKLIRTEDNSELNNFNQFNQK
jgi:hypothetical protein